MADTHAKIAEIIRLEENYTHGVFGVMRINKRVFCFTLEPDDRWNQPNISCIPPQQYLCKRTLSPRFADTFEVLNVPGRSHILFHPGNTKADTSGCILLGRSLGRLKDLRGVMHSAKTFTEFMEIMESIDYFHLTIKEEY
jgi:hypothetical protein